MSGQMPLIANVDPAVRRAFDYYPTPAWMTRALLRRIELRPPNPPTILEPCSGMNAITDVLRDARARVVTNDLNPETPAESHLDATQPSTWAHFNRTAGPVWAVTNPPFNLADQIVPLAVAYMPCVAMVLRLSWLEPTEARAAFLKKHAPNRLIVLPRHDFKGRGSTDSVTSAWFVWDDGPSGIEIVTKDERDELIAESHA